jgi:hypothetical protein
VGPRALRRLARVLGTAPALFGWLIAIAEAVAGESGDGEGIAVGVSFAAVTASALAAWRWERAGAICEILAAIAFGGVVYITAGHNRLLVALLLPSPWLLSGILFLAAARVEDGRR